MEKMALRAILFDLDGTLLPMDQDTFLKAYFKGITTKMMPYGYDPNELIKAIWAGTEAMVRNDGSRQNEAAFWDCFAQKFGEQAKNDIPMFDEFYRVEFQDVQKVCGFNKEAVAALEKLKSAGFKLALATNPLFPSVARESRIKWAGIDPDVFELYTTYENSRFSKPNPAYYADIAETIGCTPEECLMVGNDVGEDMSAQEAGMDVFLLTDCLINKGEADISVYPQGSFKELLEYVGKEEADVR